MDTATIATPAHVVRNECLMTIRDFTLGRITFDAAAFAIEYTSGLTVVNVGDGSTLLTRGDHLIAVREADGFIRTSGMPRVGSQEETDILVVHQNARGRVPYACTWNPFISEARA